MTLSRFINAFNALRFLDFNALVEAGVMKPKDNRWASFRLNPGAFLAAADDETQARIWALVEEKLG